MNKNLDEKIRKAFVHLQNILDEMEIEAYIIGGQARNIWFIEQKPEPRVTKDIDLIINNVTTLDSLKQRLTQKEAYTESNIEDKLLSSEGIELDLITTEKLPKFVGLKEISERGIELIEFEHKTYKVANIPSIVLLKLIAFSQRPENRQKDIEDIAYILTHFDIYQDKIYPLFTELDPAYISARFIGIKIKEIIGNSASLSATIKGLLQAQIANPKESTMAQIMVKGTEKPESFAIEQFKQLLQGLT